jgi:hypothetical protein
MEDKKVVNWDECVFKTDKESTFKAVVIAPKPKKPVPMRLPRPMRPFGRQNPSNQN